jgi:hypothetical protein
MFFISKDDNMNMAFKYFKTKRENEKLRTALQRTSIELLAAHDLNDRLMSKNDDLIAEIAYLEDSLAMLEDELMGEKNVR